MVRVAEKLYYILIFSFILPSGNLFNIPIKLLLCGLILLATVLSGERIKFDKITWLVVFVFASLLFWAMIAGINGYSDTIFQCMKQFIAMLIIIWLTYLFVSNKVIQIDTAFKCFQIVAITLVGIKFICECIFLAKVLSYNDILSLYFRVFNTQLTSLAVSLGGITFYRVMATNDALPILYWSFFLIMNRKFVRKLLLTIIMALFCFVAYSRVILAQFFLCLFVVGFIKLCNVDWGKAHSKQTWSCVLVFMLFALTVLILAARSEGGQQLINTVYRRFFGSDASFSDSFRRVQKEYLLHGFLQSPVFGKGTGAYVEECIRSETAKFSYELEYLSFLYQFGIIGFLCIIGTIFYVVWRICFGANYNRDIKMIIVFNLAIWAIKPFVNPGFLASNSGIVISMILICAMHCQKSKATLKAKSAKQPVNACAAAEIGCRSDLID